MSSADQRADLDRQVARIGEWAAGNGVAVTRGVTEVGSALNARRRRLVVVDPSEIDGDLGPHEASLETLNIDFLNSDRGPAARVAVEIDAACARELAHAILRTLEAAPAV